MQKRQLARWIQAGGRGRVDRWRGEMLRLRARSPLDYDRRRWQASGKDKTIVLQSVTPDVADGGGWNGATRRTTVEESGRLWSGASRWAAYVERAPKRRSRVDQRGSVLSGGLGAKLLDKSQVRRRQREGEGGRQLRLRLGWEGSRRAKRSLGRRGFGFGRQQGCLGGGGFWRCSGRFIGPGGRRWCSGPHVGRFRPCTWYVVSGHCSWYFGV